MADDQKLKVFLCHAREDKPAIRKVYEQLQTEGMNPWLDEINLLPGQNWKHEIKRALRESEAIVICFSNKSINKTGFVQKEIKEALDLYEEQPEGAIFLIPVMLEECSIPESLEHLQVARLYEENGNRKFLEALKIRSTKLSLISSIKNDSHRPTEGNSNEVDDYRKNFASMFLELFWENYDVIKTKEKGAFQISLVGDGGVGKTSIIYVMSRDTISVVGVFEPSTQDIVAKRYQLTDDIFINDTRHDVYEDNKDSEFIERSIEKNADLLVYVTSVDHNIDSRTISIILKYSKLQIPLIIVVNKIDHMLEKNPLDLAKYLQLIKDKTGYTALPISVVNGTNIDLLRRFFIKSRNFYR